MAYNLANETEPISIRELAQKLASISDRGQVPVRNTLAQLADRNLSPVRKGYCNYKRVALDTSEIEKLGWKPMVSLEEGVKRTYLCSIINKV